jgi:branched-chain amino acid aminotransferase
MDIQIQKARNLKPVPTGEMPEFGAIFTDHMFCMDYNPEMRWHNPRIEPYGPLSLEPSAIVLHFGQSIFEGFKAYQNTDGGINLFRPHDNLRRFNRSAKTMCIPEFDEELILYALKLLISMERNWVPSSMGTSLYIRPLIIAMDNHVGLRESYTYRFFIILSPVGTYFSKGFTPIKVHVETERIRSAVGGVGNVKTAGNYAATLLTSKIAQSTGCQQVLWLDSKHRKYVEEAGAMNAFFLVNGELLTPSLSGSILPGITRDSIIKLSQKKGYKVTERKISMDELIDAHANNILTEAFGCSTAMVIAPIGEMVYKGETITIGDGKTGTLANSLYEELISIQHGKTPDVNGWIEPAC